MKKIAFTFCLLIMVSLTAVSQETFSLYPSAYYDRDYVIDISFNNNNDYTLHIEVESKDEGAYFAGVRVSEKAMARFLEDLNTAKELYKEFSKQAQREGTQYGSQKLDFKSKVLGGYFKKRGKEYLDYSIQPQYYFDIERKYGNPMYLLRIKTGRMISPVFEHMQCTNAEIVFSNVAEIDEFMEAIRVKSY